MTERIQIIRLNSLKPIDIAIVAGHVAICIGLWWSVEQQYLTEERLKNFIHFYFFALPLAVVGLFYARLRSFSFFFIWVAFGVVQLLAYPELSQLNKFHFLRGTAFSGLVALLPTLLMFQVLRIIFLLTHKMEMIVSIRQYRPSRWDDDEQRNMTWLEVLFSVILLATTIISNALG